MNSTYQKTSPFVCTIERDDDDFTLVLTGWNLLYIEDNLEKEFPDFPIVPGEYVVRGVFLESSEARDHEYPGSYDLGVVEANYTRISP